MIDAVDSAATTESDPKHIGEGLLGPTRFREPLGRDENIVAPGAHVSCHPHPFSFSDLSSFAGDLVPRIFTTIRRRQRDRPEVHRSGAIYAEAQLDDPGFTGGTSSDIRHNGIDLTILFHLEDRHRHAVVAMRICAEVLLTVGLADRHMEKRLLHTELGADSRIDTKQERVTRVDCGIKF